MNGFITAETGRERRVRGGEVGREIDKGGGRRGLAIAGKRAGWVVLLLVLVL